MEKEERRTEKPEKLNLWQQRLTASGAEYDAQVSEMDDRERLYNGSNALKPVVSGDKKDLTTPHVRNIVFENIETQISSSIPAPKVTPRRAKDEKLASIIEHWLRNELDRLPFERLNDMAERTVPMQGGVGFLVEWDNTQKRLDAVGELTVNVVHPKQFGPQPGVYTGIDAMDWFIVKVPTTKGAILRKYGVCVEQEGESEPEIRSVDGGDNAEDAVTEYIGYQRNENGGIDKYCWVNDTQLEDLENYQARRLPVCVSCGRIRPAMGQVIRKEQPVSGNLLPDPQRDFLGALLSEPSAEEIPAEPETYDGGACPWCGGEKFETREQEYEEIYIPITSPGGVVIPGEHLETDGEGTQVWMPTKVPFYQPKLFPIVLQKSVSVHGQLLGNSDVDQIKTQQNTINRMEKKIIDRLCKAMYKNSTEDGEVWHVEKPDEKALIDVYQFSGNLQYEMAYLGQVYEEARQILGITDSFQGRHDATATSGKAKEFAAAQAAGRLESKRVMKNAAYAQIFELMFKFALAYSDESRAVSYKNFKGETMYEEFNRYDFLEKDANGQWQWNDQFLFSCDTSAPLASNREAMWQETRMNLQTGAFGDPASTDTLILFWEKMEMLHYPGAGDTKKYLEERKKQEQRHAAAQAADPHAAPGNPMPPGAAL